MRETLLILMTILLILAPASAGLDLAEPDDPVPTVVAPASQAPWAREVVRELDRATTVNDGDGDKVFDDLEAAYLAQPGTALPVIVTFTHETPPEAGLEQVQQTIGDPEPRFVWDILPGFAAELTLDQALRLGQLDAVRQVELDHRGTPELDTATEVMGADHVAQDLGVTGDRDGNETTFTRDDVTIAVLDTGFDGDHADLDDGKILHFLDIANGQEEAYDSGSHGTHVASIAAGTGDGDGAYTGVAPGASIVGIKIVDSESSCDLSTPVIAIGCTGASSFSLAIEGYEWIVEHKGTYGIDVSTISFGFGTATDGTTALELAVDEVWEAGVVNFKSTGNGGPEQRTITVPAAARGILATGAMLDPQGAGGSSFMGTGLGEAFGFQLATFSSRGPTTDGRIKPDITAPGVSITAALAGSQDGYAAFSGTSMASPFAAGTAALVLDANPGLSPDEVRDVLTGTTEDWGLDGSDVDYGWGRLQVATAVAEAGARAGQALPAEQPVIPFHETFSGTLYGDAVELTFEVEETEMPLAATAILDGLLAQILVEDPSGDLVASFQPTNPVARQHVVGFEPTETGTYTIRLVGEPTAPYVVDVSHGMAGGVPIDLPDAPLEATGAEGQEDPGSDAIPLGLGALVAGLLAAVALGRRFS